MSVTWSDRINRDREILERRVTDASPLGDNWNDWPSGLDCIQVEELDCSDPLQAYRYAHLLGVAQGGGGKMRQVRSKLLPIAVSIALTRHRPHGRLYDIESVHFVLATPHGQVDSPETRNILALFDPRRGYDFKANRSVFDTPALVVTLGCDHDYDGSHPYGPNRGYYQATCKRCGHRFEVDSGD